MKYQIVPDDIVHQDGRTLHRVRRIADGLLGGYIESESNLDQAGACFLFDKSRAYDNARITGDAELYGTLYGDAVLGGNASVFGEVFDAAQVQGHARVQGRAYGRARIADHAQLFGQAFDDAVIEGHAKVYGQISGSARASGDEVIYGVKNR